MRGARGVLVVLRERRRSLGRPRRRFQDNIEKILKTWIGKAETVFVRLNI